MPAKEADMFDRALVFFIIAIIAGIPWFGGVVGAAFSLSQILFFNFLFIFTVALLAGWRRQSART
jgi:uncharacterized membrane protein YtjA (UPF0391 family)